MKHVIVIGGGVAGLQCAGELLRQGVAVTILEKEGDVGGKIRNWHKLFPTFTPADEVLTELRHRLEKSPNLTIRTGCEAVKITTTEVTLASGEELKCDAAVIATGFTLFNAKVKEEYGYGIYDNVITSAKLEQMLNGEQVKPENPRRERK